MRDFRRRKIGRSARNNRGEGRTGNPRLPLACFQKASESEAIMFRSVRVLFSFFFSLAVAADIFAQQSQPVQMASLSQD
jgi:hypothetical protein